MNLQRNLKANLSTHLWMKIGITTVFMTYGVFVFSPDLHAEEDSGLMDILERQFSVFEEGLEPDADTQRTEGLPPLPWSPEVEEAWVFQHFWLRFRPLETFTVGFASITLEPELEIGWLKPAPEGWEAYIPEVQGAM